MQLAEAAADILDNGSTTQDILCYLGRCFVRAGSHFGYEKMIKVSALILLSSTAVFPANMKSEPLECTATRKCREEIES